MSRDRRHLVLTAITVCAACALMATPAFAEDGRGGGSGRSGRDSGGDDHGRVTTTTTVPAPAQPRGDDRGRGDDRPRPVVNPAPQQVVHVDEDNRGPGNARDRDRDNDEGGVATVNNLVTAINGEVATLTNAAAPFEMEDEKEVESEHIRVISLGNLTAGLSATDAAAVTNAVNANTATLQSFLGSGGANANAIDNALNAISVAPSSVLAILSDGEHLLVVTA